MRNRPKPAVAEKVPEHPIKAETEEEQQIREFYYWFYAARLYDAGNLYYTQAITCYENAIKSTESPEKKDNALWYLLKTKLKLSVDQTLSTIKEYASSWYDPETVINE